MIDINTGGIVGVFVYLLYKDFVRPKWNGRKGINNDKPGKAEKCIEHIATLASINTNIGNIKDRLNKLED